MPSFGFAVDIGASVGIIVTDVFSTCNLSIRNSVLVCVKSISWIKMRKSRTGLLRVGQEHAVVGRRLTAKERIKSKVI